MNPSSIDLPYGKGSLHADVWDGGCRAHVLLLHGLGGNAITWHGVGPLLAERLGATVFALDLPGFGLSRPPRTRLGVSALAAVVEHVLVNRAPRNTRWQLAGNSLGGVLALRVAARRPELIDRLTLASPALPLAWGRNARELLALRAYVPAALPSIGRHLITRYVLSTGVPGVVDDPVQQLFGDATRLDAELRQRLIAVSRERLGWARDAARALEQTTLSLGVALLDPRRAQRWIEQVEHPVRAIWGSVDPLFPEAAWRRLAAQRPDWHHVAMPGIGHVPQLEAPTQFAEHMLAEPPQRGAPASGPRMRR